MATPDLALIVEDDLAIRRGLVDALGGAGFATLEAGDGASGEALALERPVRLVLLDLVLPRKDGLAVLRAIRAAKPALPVILITARGAEDDRVAGLRLGADDYVVKPFSIRELLARIDALLRRSPARAEAPETRAIPGGTLDLARNEIRFDDGSREEMSDLESRLLAYLAAAEGRLVPRDELLVRVWEIDPRRIETRTVDMTVARLRKKLRDGGATEGSESAGEPRVLLTVRGRGYRLA
ncbi:MAG TPA: response regulator transcription factor [Thermoanaerobaculia bacterium]|jgi:DNA-binding response OmpR family regulator|nr:response regulator transcription factor [Thermoanaerobaculia bacterium]